MRNLLEKRMDTITALQVFYDTDHRQKELSLICRSGVVSGTGKKVTEKQLSGISQVLYHDPAKFSYALQTPISFNLLRAPVSCQLVFSFGTLVAIADKEGKNYCDLETGNVISEKTIFHWCKYREMEREIEEIQLLKDTLQKEMAAYKKWKASAVRNNTLSQEYAELKGKLDEIRILKDNLQEKMNAYKSLKASKF